MQSPPKVNRAHHTAGFFADHWLSFVAAEGGGELGHVCYYVVHSIFVQRMRIGEDLRAHRFRRGAAAPVLSLLPLLLPLASG